MRIYVDAMGGDNAPQAPVAGALEALEKNRELELVLAGPEKTVSQTVDSVFQTEEQKKLLNRVTIVDCPEVITNEEAPVMAVRHKKQSAIVDGMLKLRDGEVDAFVSAGSTGAVLAGGMFRLGRLHGVERPALAPLLPNGKDFFLLIDCGANVDCRPEYLHQFAQMGTAYMQTMRGVANPRVGLVNNGAEAEKGCALTKAAYEILSADDKLNFVGNVEARDVFSGNVDVLVCDGFSGNVLLKCIEGTAMMLMKRLKGIFYKNTANKLAAAVLKKDVYALKSLFDPSEVGGTALLGISKPVIKAHGSSDARAIRSAVRQAITFIDSDVIGSIEKNVAYMRISPNEGE